MRRIGPLLVALLSLCLTYGAVSPARAVTLAGSTTYSCAFSGNSTTPLDMTFTMGLPDAITAGSTIGSQPALLTIAMSESAVALLRADGVQQVAGSALGVAATVGPTRIPIDGLVFPQTAVPASGPMTLTANGTSESVTAPRAGTYNAVVPLSMALHLTFSPPFYGYSSTDGACNLAGPSTLGSVRVGPASVSSKVAARQKGRRLIVRATRSDGAVATGTVTAKVGGRRALRKPLSGGRAVIRLPRVARPTWVRVMYAGPADVALSSTRVRIR